jgi:hypothetical protein
MFVKALVPKCRPAVGSIAALSLAVSNSLLAQSVGYTESSTPGQHSILSKTLVLFHEVGPLLEPAIVPMTAGACLVLLLSRRTRLNSGARTGNRESHTPPRG